MTTDVLENTIAQSLMAIGLYTVGFESTALCFRAKVYEYLCEHDPTRLPKFLKSTKTAYATFEFCGEILIAQGILSQSEIDSLHQLRDRRNLFTHESYNRVFDLKVQEVLPDVQQLHGITAKVDRWVVPRSSPCDLKGATPFRISPAFFGFVGKIVENMSYGRLDLRDKRSDA